MNTMAWLVDRECSNLENIPCSTTIIPSFIPPEVFFSSSKRGQSHSQRTDTNKLTNRSLIVLPQPHELIYSGLPSIQLDWTGRKGSQQRRCVTAWNSGHYDPSISIIMRATTNPGLSRSGVRCSMLLNTHSPAMMPEWTPTEETRGWEVDQQQRSGNKIFNLHRVNRPWTWWIRNGASAFTWSTNPFPPVNVGFDSWTLRQGRAGLTCKWRGESNALGRRMNWAPSPVNAHNALLIALGFVCIILLIKEEEEWRWRVPDPDPFYDRPGGVEEFQLFALE